MKISSVSTGKIYQPGVVFAKKSRDLKNEKSNSLNDVNERGKKSNFKKVLPYLLMTTVAAGGVAVGYLFASKKAKIQSLEIQALKDKTEGVLKSLQEKIKDPESKSLLAVLALAGIGGYEAGKISEKDSEVIIDRIVHGQTPLQSAAYGASDQIGKINNFQTNPTSQKYGADFYGLSLLTENNALNRNSQKYNNAIKFIQDIGYEKLTSINPLPYIEKEPKDTTIWSVTSEFAPIKEGGLGSVPVEVRNNIAKLGINIPTFVPMYLHEGVSTFSKEDEEIIYNYKGKKFNLEKVASFKMDVFKDGKPKTVPVEFYLNTEQASEGANRQLVFIKCDEYFDGTIYETNSKTEEQEKFAVMSKAVYEFAKLRMDGAHALKDVEISSNSSLRAIKTPDVFMLNDWQASPLAALVRYKSGLENAYGKISDETTKALQNMRIITLGHNVAYQGKTEDNNNDSQRKAVSSRILNTLFDKYAYDIVSNARVGTGRINPYDNGLQKLDNTLVMNYMEPHSNHVNFLNMGIILSDYFNPVSKNYAQELVSDNHRELSHSLQWALVQKNKAGKLVGVINGNDYNNISLRAKKSQIKAQTGVDFEITSKLSPDEVVFENKERNKKEFYNKFVLPFSKSSSSSAQDIENVKSLTQKLEFCEGAQGTTLPVLSNSQLNETPILMSGGRLVSQKGIGVLCDSIKILFDNWEKDFPNCPKPIFYIAGSDGEGGSQRKIIEDLKDNRLSKEDNDRILFAHGFAPLSGFMAASDFFLMPSMFEPCGLTQGESMAVATPVVASAVGGIVDTVNRDGKENGILTDKNKKLDAQEFYLAMKKALEIYFYDKPRYKNMVKDSLAENFSWIQKNKQGPVFEYLDIMGIKTESLPEVAQ